MTVHPDYDTADLTHRALASMSGLKRLAFAAILDLPPDTPVAALTAMTDDLVRQYTAREIGHALINDRIPAEDVMTLLALAGLLRPGSPALPGGTT